MLQSPRPSGDSRSCRNINWQPRWAEICLIADYRGTDFQVSAAYLMPTLDGVSMVQWRWKLGVGSLESRVWRLDFASDPAVLPTLPAIDLSPDGRSCLPVGRLTATP